MPKTKKSSKRTTKQSEMPDLDMPSQIGGESGMARGEYGRRSTRPRTAARSTSATRGSRGSRTTSGRKSGSSRSSGRGGTAKKSTGGRGRSTKRGSSSRRSR